MTVVASIQVRRRTKKHQKVQIQDRWFKRCVLTYAVVHSILCAICISAIVVNYLYPGHWYFQEVQTILRGIFGT